MSEMQPSISSGRKFNAIWIIPLVALVAGVSIVVHSYMTEGPTITIEFRTAADLKPGKTKIKLLDVDVGLVESVVIKPDMSSVIATVKLDQNMRDHLNKNTRFWIVRASVGAGGVSGLGTILAGAYIKMAPGDGAGKQKAFIGLESPPQTPADAPGIRLTLFSDRAGSVSAGNSVLYNGYAVGRVETMTFDADKRQARYEIFIDAPYHELVNSSTRFWNVSGISLETSTMGIKIRTGSLDTVLLGGVAFAAPPGVPAGGPIESGKEFKLFDSYDEILTNPYRFGAYYVVMFKQSLRGLAPGAPVEYRGIQIGRVERLLMKELAAGGLTGGGASIPVLIYIEPGRIELADTQESVDQFKRVVKKGVTRDGMRATLETGNLLTGKKLISIDYFADKGPAELGQFDQYAVIPTIETGVARLQQQASDFLAKLNALPLEETVAEANNVLGNADSTLAALNLLLASDESQALPGELASTLADLRDVLAGFSQDSQVQQGLGASVNTLSTTLQSLDVLIRQLSIKPNSIIFPVSHEADPVPEAYSR